MFKGLTCKQNRGNKENSEVTPRAEKIQLNAGLENRPIISLLSALDTDTSFCTLKHILN